MNAYFVMVRREYWEHRALWVPPLILAGLYVLLCLIPGVDVSGIHIDSSVLGKLPSADSTSFASAQMLFTVILFGLETIVAFYYLSDCLYAERKDRSILFWKSLPVSDAATVLTKLAVGVLVLPLGVYLVSVVSNLLAFGILYARFHSSVVLGPFIHWDPALWLRLNVYLILDVLVMALWYAPIAAYQLLISAWAKNSVFLWTLLPPLVLVFGEKFVFNTWNIGGYLVYRLGTGLNTFNTSTAGMSTHGTGPLSLGGKFSQFNLLPVLGTADMWIGVAIAVVLLFVTIRIRRYRDDS
ncbi:MAG: hypothetical protein ABI885_05155 [Gammaproteobacteria bacterium]